MIPQIRQPETALSQAQLFLQEEKYEEALAILAELIQENPSQRELRIYRLLMLRILFLHQALVQSPFAIIKKPLVVMQETVSRLTRTLVVSAWLDVAQWIARVRHMAQMSVAIPVERYDPLVIASFHRRLTTKAPYIGQGLSWIREAVKASIAAAVARPVTLGVVLVAAPLILITLYLSGSPGVAKQQLGDPRREPDKLSSPNNASLTNASGIEAERPKPRLIDERSSPTFAVNQFSSVSESHGGWVGKNQHLTESLLLKLPVNSLDKVLRGNDIESSLTASGSNKVVLSEARERKLRSAALEAPAFAVSLLFVPARTHPESVVPMRGTLEPFERDENARSTLQNLSVLPPAAGRPVESSTHSAAESSRKGRVKASAKEPSAAEMPNKILITSTTRRSVPLRGAPSYAAASVKEIDGGTPISIIGVAGDWLRVKIQKSGVMGYVRKEYIAFADAPMTTTG